MNDAARLSLDDLTQPLFRHPIYEHVSDERSLGLFMRAHVFCVWDFQSLLKALQRALTCVEVPWLPTADPLARRLINEIVLDEESDEHPDGGYTSHFELYLEAMDECGADRGPIDRFIAELRAGRPVRELAGRDCLPPGVGRFLRATFDAIDSGEALRIVASFTYGREDILPDVFRQLVTRLAARTPERWGKFLYYLNRHIDTDGERHGPIARSLVAHLCGDDELRWRTVETTAREALAARAALWDATLEEIRRPAAAGA